VFCRKPLASIVIVAVARSEKESISELSPLLKEADDSILRISILPVIPAIASSLTNEK